VDIYFLLGLSLFSVFSFMFLIIGLNADEWWHKIVYFFLSLLTSFVGGLFWMATLISLGPVFMFFFSFIGIIDFVLIILISLQAYNLKYPSRNKRYRPEVE
jgi:hypothetical protein